MRFAAIPFFTLAFTLALFLCGCPQSDELPEAQLADAYAAAIADARVAELDEISHHLTAIRPETSGLIWEGTPGESRILMCMWSDWEGYTEASAGEVLTTPWEFWVTVAPEIQQWTQQHPTRCAYLERRLEQLLGLPPHDGKDRFVEFWVEPADLFRPSPDPEITDQEAELDFPQSSLFLTVSEEYIAWFEALCAVSYEAGGYPWTRLGYTYDWGAPHTDIGLSEFIIRAGATVEIRAVAATAAYCDCCS